MPENPQPAGAALKVFYSYSHKDEKLRGRLEEHLSMLRRQGIVSEWHDRRLTAGSEWAGHINEHLKAADIILLLISSSFLASDYCYDVELKLALERHRGGESRIIPVILRPCDWTKTLFGELQALPKDGRPVTKWSNRDDAFTDVVGGIRRVAEELNGKRREGVEPAGALQTGEGAAGVEKCATSLIPRPPFVGFVARRDESGRDIIELLGRELAPDRNQLVAIWGPGGVGKSTLAAEFVRATEAVFDGRVAWVGALGRAEFGLATLLNEIATQLGREDLRKLAPEPKAAQVAGLLSGAPTLIILDNFETVAEEEQARCLDFLAQNAICPVLITTRAFVDRDDVSNVELAAMKPDEAREFLRRLIERTPKSQKFARLDQDELIRKCEANPLILQWVVRQIVLSKTPQTALDYLAKGEGDAAEHVFTRSFNLPQLGEHGRAALLALSLFTPDASREALAEVSGLGDDLRLIEKAVGELSALWLVETTEGNERLFLRGLTRGLAKSRLSSDVKADDLRRRYVAYFRRYAAAHPQATAEDMGVLEAEKDNLLGAMDEAFRVKDWEGVMWIRRPLTPLFYLRGYWDEAVKSGEQAKTAARNAASQDRVALFASHVAIIRRERGEYEAAARAYEEALELFRQTGSEDNVAVCLHELGIIASMQEDEERARRCYNESLEIRKRIGNEWGTAATLNQLGKLAKKHSNLEEARQLYEKGLEISKKFNDERVIAITLHLLANLKAEEGDASGARRLYIESLEITKRLGDKNNLAFIFTNLGLLEVEEGNKKEAVRLLHEALSMFEELGSPMAEDVCRELAKVEGASG